MTGPLLLAHGDDLPPPLTLARAFRLWEPDPVVLTALAVVAGLYLVGVVVLARRGIRWSPWRTVSFLGGGIGTLAIATLSAVGVYDDVLFSDHMVQHMVLTMVTPVFLGLGAPVTLALRTLPRRPRGWLLALLHSRLSRVLTFPVVSFPIFVGTLYALYFTPLYQLSLEHPLFHEILHVHFVAAGSLFLWPLLGLDPIPNRLPYPLRLLALLVTLPVHAFLGIAIMSTDTVIAGDYYRELHRAWGGSLLADQHLGGGLLWASGDALGLLLFGVLAVQWAAADDREARRTDRLLDRREAAAARQAAHEPPAAAPAGAQPARPGYTDDELDAYNAKLAALARLDSARSRRPSPG